MINVSQINDKIEKEKNKLIADYKRFVESPSVSSQSEHKKDILPNCTNCQRNFGKRRRYSQDF
jgi:hypothetical protein